MRLSFSDWLIIALYFAASAAIGLAYTRKPADRSRSTSSRAGASLVARRDIDGGDHLLGRYAARRGRIRGEVRCRGQLALVERRVLGSPDRLLLRPALAAGRRAHRSGIRRAPVRREAGGGAPRLSSALSRASDQSHHHGMGHAGDGHRPPGHARRESLEARRFCSSAITAGYTSSRDFGASWSPIPSSLS